MLLSISKKLLQFIGCLIVIGCFVLFITFSVITIDTLRTTNIFGEPLPTLTCPIRTLDECKRNFKDTVDGITIGKVTSATNDNISFELISNKE